MIKICLSNRKGGVSKTTTAVNMSSILTEMGYKVLLWMHKATPLKT